MIETLPFTPADAQWWATASNETVRDYFLTDDPGPPPGDPGRPRPPLDRPGKQRPGVSAPPPRGPPGAGREGDAGPAGEGGGADASDGAVAGRGRGPADPRADRRAALTQPEPKGRRLHESRPGTEPEPAHDKEPAMKLGDAFPSRWLKAADCDDEPMTLTIRQVEMEEFKEDSGQMKDKLVARFDETDKALVVNVTNAKVIGGLYGNDTDDWVGKRIVLIATEVQFGSDMVPALRVSKKATGDLAKKKATPKAEKPAPAPAVAAKGNPDADGVDEDEDIDIPF